MRFTDVRWLRTAWIAALLIAWPVQALQADVLDLRNGDRLSGRFSGYDGKILKFRSDYGESLKIPKDKIKALTTDGVVTLRLEQGGTYTGQLVADYGGVLGFYSAETGARGTVAFADIAEMVPGRTFGSGLDWSGEINLGGSERSGNTATRSLHFDAAIVGRGKKDRFTFKGEFDRETDSGVRTEDSFEFSLQHDHFRSDIAYFFTVAKLERDKPADLRLRTNVGTGLGYQIYESPRTYLSAELGPSYINEDHFDGADGDFVSARWAVDFRQTVWRSLSFFHEHEGVIDLEDTARYFIDSSTGLRAPLRAGFVIKATIDIDYESEPAQGKKATDRAVLLTIGYAW